jgi:hypothetical protein
MLNAKKTWQKPKLIILARGRPEELVLAGCKMAIKSAGAKNKNSSCYQTSNKCPNACSVVSTS